RSTYRTKRRSPAPPRGGLLASRRSRRIRGSSRAVRPRNPEAVRRLARILGRTILALGWSAFAVYVILFLAEESGLLTYAVRRVLAERLGPAGRELAIDHVALEWFAPRIRLDGVRLGAGGEMLRIEEATVTVDPFGDDASRISRLQVS